MRKHAILVSLEALESAISYVGPLFSYADHNHMIKAIAQIKEGWVVIIGLTLENIAKIKENDPVFFKLSELVPGASEWVCLSYKNKEGKAAGPIDGKGYLFAFDDEALDGITNGALIDISHGQYKFVIFAGKDEFAMREQLKPLITEQTIAREEGFAPADRTINPN